MLERSIKSLADHARQNEIDHRADTACFEPMCRERKFTLQSKFLCKVTIYKLPYSVNTSLRIHMLAIRLCKTPQEYFNSFETCRCGMKFHDFQKFIID